MSAGDENYEAIRGELRRDKRKRCLDEENSSKLDHHDYVPKKKLGKLWVVMARGRKPKKRGKIHFPSDFRFDPHLHEENITDAKENVQCFKNRDDIVDAHILWMTLGHAVRKSPIYSERDHALCLCCTPEWIRSNWDFAIKCGFSRGWNRWRRQASTDNYFHTEACATLHDANVPFEVVRVEEEAVLKDGSPWKPCLYCHEKRHESPATPRPRSPSY